MTKLTVLTPELLKELMASLKGGASSQGLTYHGNIIQCAKKQRLNEMYKAMQAEQPEDGEEDAPGKFSWLRVGIFGHKLFELNLTGRIGLVVEGSTESPELQQAILMYNMFNAFFGSLPAFLGAQILGAEVQLGESAGVALEVVKRLGDKLTGRADAIVNVVDSDRCYENTGFYLLPGRWIVDYKFGSKHSASDAVKFSTSLQAANYCYLDELEQGPGQGAMGVIFIRLIGHKTMSRDKSFAVYVAHKSPDDEQRLKSVVTISNAVAQLGLGNGLACVDFFGRECWWKKQKVCPGY